MDVDDGDLKAWMQQRLVELGGGPKRSLGQNFLVSRRVRDRIIQEVQSFNPRALVEIGPGLGVLTEELLKLGIPIHLIELDQRLCTYWRSRGVPVEEADALRIEWSNRPLPRPAVLVSNLPYQIAASLVIDLSVQVEPPFQAMVLMFQKEVAERILARPASPQYGLLSVVGQCFWRVAVVTDAGQRDFYPAPKVNSRVLAFRVVESGDVAFDRQGFLKFLKAGFAHRRKKLARNLEGMAQANRLSMEQMLDILQNLGIDSQARAEVLSPALWQKLYLALTRPSE